VETIYYGHVPPARDWRLSKGRPGVVLRATRGVRNNIPYMLAWWFCRLGGGIHYLILLILLIKYLFLLSTLTSRGGSYIYLGRAFNIGVVRWRTNV